MVADPNKIWEKIGRIRELVEAVHHGQLSLGSFSAEEQDLLNKALEAVDKAGDIIENRNAKLAEQQRIDNIIGVAGPAFFMGQLFETEEALIDAIRKFAEFHHVPFELEKIVVGGCENINPGLSGQVIHTCRRTEGNLKAEYAVVCEDGVLKLFTRIFVEGSESPLLDWCQMKERVGNY